MVISDNIKFAAGFVVYIVYASWWAAGVSAGVAQNAKTSAATLAVLENHMKECGEMHSLIALTNQRSIDNAKHIEVLNNIIFIPKPLIQ